MKIILSLILLIFTGLQSSAQFSKASLQASGLTCSMCSKAVKNALEKVAFVENIRVDIKNQQYNFDLKKDEKIDFDVLSKAVEDAGFSVASLKVTAEIENIKAVKDSHVQIGDKYFHFLNAKGQALNGATTFSIVDKSFVPAKDFKKYSSATKMQCVQTGKAAACCTKENISENTRVYHAII